RPPSYTHPLSLHDALPILFKHFDYAGVLTVEFFVKRGRLIANEMAPRVHNSGHWTIEGAHTSQFENHIRAILGLPLGSTSPIGQDRKSTRLNSSHVKISYA